MATLLDFTDPGREEEQQPLRVKPPRVQSPSSILTYQQCPRKYFYRYIAKIPGGTSIHLVRGSVAHKVLEGFYAKNLSTLPDDQFPIVVKVMLQEMFRKEWDGAKPDLDGLGLSMGELDTYYEETKVMVHNFFHYFMDKLRECSGMTLAEAFEHVKPRTEVKLVSEKHHVMGFADAVHEHDGKRYVLDYKTSKSCEITDDYYLQLSIYGLIFEELGQAPDEVGIFFLKHGQELRIPLTAEMISFAKKAVHSVHAKVASKKIEDYPMKPGPLCKWSSGQCDYYEFCFGNRRLNDFVQIGK